jgi:hypothetical protein
VQRAYHTISREGTCAPANCFRHHARQRVQHAVGAAMATLGAGKDIAREALLLTKSTRLPTLAAAALPLSQQAESCARPPREQTRD